nr:biotin/lipoyl-binding protein [Flavobacteriales bacterium]
MSKEVEIKVPSPGESISEVRIAQWLVENGDVVEKDQPIAEIDSDKATLELTSEEEGKITLLVEPDTEVAVGDVVAKVDTSVKAEKKAKAEAPKKEEAAPKAKEAAAANGQGKAKAPAVEAHATPVAKAVMAEKGVDAGQVKGSGPNGRI